MEWIALEFRLFWEFTPDAGPPGGLCEHDFVREREERRDFLHSLPQTPLTMRAWSNG